MSTSFKMLKIQTYKEKEMREVLDLSYLMYAAFFFLVFKSLKDPSFFFANLTFTLLTQVRGQGQRPFHVKSLLGLMIFVLKLVG